MENYLEKLFINEARPALSRHSGGGGGGTTAVIAPLEITKNGVYKPEPQPLKVGSTYTFKKVISGYDAESLMATDWFSPNLGYVLGGFDLYSEMDGFKTCFAYIPSSLTGVAVDVFTVNSPTTMPRAAYATGAIPEMGIPTAGWYDMNAGTPIDPPSVTILDNSFVHPVADLAQFFDGVDSVDGYAPITVNVESDGAALARSIVDGTITEYSDNEVTKVRKHAFRDSVTLTSVDLPNVTEVGDSAFYGCTTLVSANIPNATDIGTTTFSDCKALKTVNLAKVTCIKSNTFMDCKMLTSLDLPNVTKFEGYSLQSAKGLISVNLPNLTNVPDNAFKGCSKLPNIYLPKVPSLSSSAFSTCYLLTTIDLPKVNSIASNAFYSCCSLTALILRSETMCTLSNTNAFNNCCHILGTTQRVYGVQDSSDYTYFNEECLKDGYIYVPSALVDTYKSATNWVTYADQIRALEDYTVDGTITGALDETKI